MIISAEEKKAAAVKLANQWLQLFPLVPTKKQPLRGWNYKKATNNAKEVAEWFSGGNSPDIAIRLVGVAVLDIDNHKDDPQALSKARQWLLQRGVDVKQLQSETYIESTPKKGVHMYFLTPENFSLQKVALTAGIELIGNFVTCYPSTGYHPLNGDFDIKKLAPLPQALIDLAKDAKPAAAMHGVPSRPRGSYSSSPTGLTYLGSFIEEVASGASEGGRNSWFASVIGKMLASGASPEACYNLTLAINDCFTTPPLPQRELETTFNSILARHIQEVG